MARREPKLPNKAKSKYDPSKRTTTIRVRKPVSSLFTIDWSGLNGLWKQDWLAEGLLAIAAVCAELPDPEAPDVAGWRWWRWDPVTKRLMSPSQGTIWHEPEMRAEAWSTDEAVRGEAGIHARRVPINWREAHGPEVPEAKTWQWSHHMLWGTNLSAPIITGLVERFGKFVQGSEGWRAEWVVIRKLHAPTEELAEELRQAYPELDITWSEPCK